MEIYQSGVGWVRLDPTQYAQYTGPDLEDSFNKDEYDDLIQKNPNGDWNDNISGGGGGSWGDDSSNSGGSWGDDSSNGGDDSDDDSSNSGDDSDDDSSNSGGGWDDDSSNSGDDSGDDDSSSGGGDKDSSTSSSKDTDSDSSKPDDVSSESSKDSLESSESQSSEAFGCNDVPWLPIGIGAAVIAGTIVTVLLIRLLKKPKRKMKKVDLAKKNLTEEETLLLEEEIHRAAAQIIRENYKDFIKLAGKNGIGKYPIDTTRSLRNRYNREIGESFGKTVHAIFTDEPQMYAKKVLDHASDKTGIRFPYTNDFDESFTAKYGMHIEDHFPVLVWENADGSVSPIRYYYHDHSTERFAEAFCDNVGKSSFSCAGRAGKNHIPDTVFLKHTAENTVFSDKMRLPNHFIQRFGPYSVGQRVIAHKVSFQENESKTIAAEVNNAKVEQLEDKMHDMEEMLAKIYKQMSERQTDSLKNVVEKNAEIIQLKKEA